MLSVLKENRKWNQGESVLGQIFNSYRVTSCFPSEKVKILLCNCYAEWSMSAGLLKLFSKAGHKCKACSQQLTAPSFLRNKANICNEEWNVPRVFKPTTLTSRIIRFQRQKEKKNQGDIHCMDQMMRNWVVIWDSFTRKRLKGFHMNRTRKSHELQALCPAHTLWHARGHGLWATLVANSHRADKMKFSKLWKGVEPPGKLAGHRICGYARFWLSSFSKPTKMLHSVKLIAERDFKVSRWKLG